MSVNYTTSMSHCVAAKVHKLLRANMPEAARRDAIRRVVREGDRKAVVNEKA